MTRVSPPLVDRFWVKVDKTDDCWLWTAARDRRGYGRFNRTDIGKTVFAHRYSYELAHGTLPDLPLDHLCRNTSCVRPDHLEPVPHAVNVARGLAGAAATERYARPRECPQGHPMSGDNLYTHVTKRGYVNRQCRTCRHDSKQGRARGATH